MRKILPLLLCSLFLAGCTARALLKTELGMSKMEVRRLIGTPNIIRGSKVDELGQSIEVWEYRRIGHDFGAADYSFVFVDGKLVQWGESGTWEP